MKVRRRVAAATALLLAAVAGCDSGTSTGSDSGLEKDTVVVAALPLLDVAALHIAMARRMFQAEGLTVKVQPVAQSLAALPALQNGQVDVIAGANYVTFLQAHAQGTLKLKIIADGAAQAPRFMRLLVAPDSPIRTPADLAGRTVAVNILNNIQSLTLNEILTAEGVDPSTVKYRAVPFPLMDKALAGGDVDAVHTGEPFGTVIERRLKARMVVDGGGPPVTGLPVSGYVSSAEFVTKYPRTAAAFQRAIEKAQALAAADRSAVERVLPSYAKVDEQTATALTLPGYPAAPDAARMRRLIGLMVKQGLLKADIDPAGLIFTPAAR
ncbi:ABC transporter substrate-binding protein [Mangrovihabitans endophyticus]|uniref:Sulfonate ABC transporter substrate-binding protein n=1 Tax=Mangrovihabitans endophyticus TaxID=1751298 RepID=A0A8J3C0E8_9ACTN|nr:ABC transporter substrate-binding protein [Mangrovihabitans endophyticus]GGK91622.1 sulfonate ABC transporter substrate-binding protein [Mangrovihabitans endophyticus]